MAKHCVKSVQIRSCFWSVFYCIKSAYRKIRTRNNSVFGRGLSSQSRIDEYHRLQLALAQYTQFRKAVETLVWLYGRCRKRKRFFGTLVLASYWYCVKVTYKTRNSSKTLAPKKATTRRSKILRVTKKIMKNNVFQ